MICDKAMTDIMGWWASIDRPGCHANLRACGHQPTDQGGPPINGRVDALRLTGVPRQLDRLRVCECQPSVRDVSPILVPDELDQLGTRGPSIDSTYIIKGESNQEARIELGARDFHRGLAKARESTELLRDGE
ncbi:hypothetical protein F511_31372 [Dorcoceras hygrometricum]|uniref:Uncharacterized protein n=1 Tax=Dorcoceras hygrometricum TaxID=472368 RepID=A0A2Z7BBT4_9LAMI|nr:hypothetical protein F511_31372 [Dorcoceras hygrometricum]